MVIPPLKGTNPTSHFMANENDTKVEEEVVEEDLSTLDSETTDWKAKAQEVEQKRREEGIRNRERTKALKEQLSKLEQRPTTTETKTDDFGLLEKTYLRAAGITTEDEVELAQTTSKKWNMPIDKLVDDGDFQAKLNTLRTSKANQTATSNARGQQGTSQAKNTPEYWIAKGELPENTPANRELLAKIARIHMKKEKEGKKMFYNE